MHRPALAAILVLLSAMAPVTSTNDPAPPRPRPTTIVERATAHLAQLDVTITGPEAATRGLGPDDFDVLVDGKPVANLVLDVACNATEAAKPPPGLVAVAPNVVETAPRPATIVFYFDQPHLTLAGRQRAIDVARDLVKRLIKKGNRAAVLSLSRRLETFAALTDDPGRLLEALDALERSGSQWDTSSDYEREALDEIERLLSEEHNTPKEMPAAKWALQWEILNTTSRLHQEELWRAGRDLRALSLSVGVLEACEPPKWLVYFADTMRKNAGEHFFGYFTESVLGRYFLQRRSKNSSPSDTSWMTSAGRTFAAESEFAKVVEEAASNGVRFYTVQAEGLVPSSRRATDAKDTLSSLAIETGGKAFLNGVSASKIATAMERDLGCLYLLSFDPSGLPRDKPLSVYVAVQKPGVRVQVRDRLVIRSESARLTSRLLSAFATPEARTDGSLAAHVIPTGYRDGKFKALVQIVAEGLPDQGATWDLGASVVSRGKVREDVSARVATTSPGTPVVLERETEFGSGPYEIVAVGHDVEGDRIFSTKVEGRWPEPDAGAVELGPVSVLQPAAGAFVRDGDRRPSGSLAVTEANPLRSDLPTAIVGLVCWSGVRGGRLKVLRNLQGATAVEFPQIDLDAAGDDCAELRDLVPAGTLGAGTFRYEAIVEAEHESARGGRTFVVRQGGE